MDRRKNKIKYLLINGHCIIKPNNFNNNEYKFGEWTSNINGILDGYNWTGWRGNWVYKNGQFGIKDNKLILYANRWKN